MSAPTLYIFAGLPASGKTTLARGLAQQLGAVHLRIDTIEHALRLGGVSITGPEGYLVAYGLAEDNLRLELNVIADSVNPIGITRRAWREVAQRAGVGWVEIEVQCSDLAEHRRRVEGRAADIAGFRLPTWQEVVQRQWDPWDTSPLRIDTARKTVKESMQELLDRFEGAPHEPG